MTLAPGHCHADPGELTIGCPACIAKVRLDQDRAQLVDAPVRRCTWRFDAGGRSYSFTLDVKVPAGWESWQVDEEYAGDTGVPIGRALGTEHFDDFYAACCTIACTSIGAIVQPVAVVPDHARLL